jgi:hypothetical protein
MRGTGPVTRNVVGPTLEKGGNFMKEHHPITGWMPPLFEPHIAKLAQKVAGSGLERVGRYLSKGPIRKVQGEIVLPEIRDGEYTVKSTPNKQKLLPPSKTSFYGSEKNPNAPIITPSPRIPKQLGPSKVFNYGEQGLVEGQELPKPRKLRVIRNSDGTFTNSETGELLDNSLNPIVPSESKIDRNSPFFTRNRQ